MKKTISILIIFLFCQISFSQVNKKQMDSLLNLNAKIKADTTKVLLLNKIARLYSDSAVSKKYLKESIALSKKLGYKNGEANAYVIEGKILHHNYQHDEAILLFKKAIYLFKQEKLSDNLGNTYYKIANVYNDKNNYSDALKNYLEAISVFEKTKNSYYLATVYGEISTIYRGLDDFEKSKNYLDLSTNILLKLKDTETLTYNYLNYAQLYERTNDTENLELYATKAFESATKNEDKNSIAVATYALGVVAKKKGQYENALSNFKKALSVFESLENYMGMASTYNETGRLYVSIYEKNKNLNNLILAKENFEASNKIYLDANLIDGLSDNYLQISQINAIQKNFEESLKNYQLYSKFNDSILNTTTKETIKSLEDKRSIELRDKELQLNKITLLSKERQNWFLICGLILVIIIGSLLYYQNKNRKKTNKKLQVLNNELDIANKSKIKLLGILNHDLRSPVSSFIHYVQLQKEDQFSLDETTKIRIENATLKSAKNLLNSMEELLFWTKNQMDNFKPQLQIVAVNTIFIDVKNHFSTEENKIIVFENPDSISLYTDENYLKTIIRNLTTNAIKATNELKNPIIVWKAWIEDKNAFLSISDNGKGAGEEKFSSLFDDTIVSGIENGLGFHLIRDLSKVINCQITMKSEENSGTTFTLHFKQ